MDLLDLTAEEVVAARLLGVAAVVRDVQACEQMRVSLKPDGSEGSDYAPPSEQGADPVGGRPTESRATDCAGRAQALATRIDAVREWELATSVAPDCALLSAGALSEAERIVDAALARLGAALATDRAKWVALEALVSTEHPQKTKWVEGKEQSFLPGLLRLCSELSSESGAELLGELLSLDPPC